MPKIIGMPPDVRHPMALSHSAYVGCSICARAYWYRRFGSVSERPPLRLTWILGSIVHQSVADWLIADRVPDLVDDVFWPMYLDSRIRQSDSGVYCGDLNPTDVVTDMCKTLRHLQDEWGTLGIEYDPFHVEMELEADMLWFPYTGDVDLACTLHGVPTVLDWKTTMNYEYTEGLVQLDEQLAGYVHLCRSIGMSVEQVAIASIPPGETVRIVYARFSESVLDNYIRRLHHVWDMIQNDVFLMNPGPRCTGATGGLACVYLDRCLMGE